MSIVDQILVILMCMLIAAFLSGIETGVIAIHRLRLRHLVRKGDPAAKILQGFLNDTDRLLGTTLVGTNLCIVVISVLATSLVEDIPGSWAEVVSSIVVTLLVLVLSEYLPKAWFYNRPLERCRRYARVLSFSELVLRPIAWTVVWATKLFVKGPPKSFVKADPFVTKDDLKMLVREGEKYGVISSSKGMMIHNVLELSGKTAKQIMVPRAKMTITNLDATIAEFTEIARVSRHTRMPVFDRERNEFAGIINSLFVASADPAVSARTVANYVRQPLFILENMPVDDILPLLRRSRHPMCLVINEKSEVTGLVTTQDIVSEIVGKNPV
jgi:putative hemolysin